MKLLIKSIVITISFTSLATYAMNRNNTHIKDMKEHHAAMISYINEHIIIPSLKNNWSHNGIWQNSYKTTFGSYCDIFSRVQTQAENNEENMWALKIKGQQNMLESLKNAKNEQEYKKQCMLWQQLYGQNLKAVK